MEMADTIVINKADGDNIRKAQAKQSSTEHLFPQKIRLDSHATSAITKTEFQSLETITIVERLTKAMIILMKTFGTK
jgi:putative protein kinase ArgK-like GTPase of G3E family